jgi:gas vesicle protein
MAQSPEELKQEIEQTRQEMTRNVDAIGDKVSPGRIVQRRVDRTKTAVGSIRERVMGSGSSNGGGLGEKASSARDSLTGAPDAAMSRTQGNPLAAGLLAFAGGMLIGSLLPASEAETQAAQALEDKMKEPVKQELGDIAGQLKDDLQPSAQEAVENVKDTASQAAQTVSEQGQQSVETVRSDAKGAADDVRQTAGSNPS